MKTRQFKFVKMAMFASYSVDRDTEHTSAGSEIIFVRAEFSNASKDLSFSLVMA